MPSAGEVFAGIFELLPVIYAASFLAGILGRMLYEDLATAWVYRVYSLDVRPLTGALSAKYIAALTEASAAVSCFVAAVSMDPRPLLYPLFFLPAAALTLPSP